MRRSTIVNLNTSRFLNTLKHNYLVIIFTVVFVLGIVFGAIWVSRNDTINSIASENFSGYMAVRNDSGVFKIFIASFFNLLPFALLIFLCGTSLVGIALTPIAVCYKGFQYGVMAGYLYKTFLLKGIAFNALMLIPCTIVAAMGLIVSGKLAFNFSYILAKVSIPRGQAVNLYSFFQNYCKQFSLTLLIFTLSAAIDAIMSAAFMNFFTF